jgi:hypothetical protein
MTDVAATGLPATSGAPQRGKDAHVKRAGFTRSGHDHTCRVLGLIQVREFVRK